MKGFSSIKCIQQGCKVKDSSQHLPICEYYSVIQIGPFILDGLFMEELVSLNMNNYSNLEYTDTGRYIFL